MQLTVAICTYGRPTEAVRLVSECLEQMGEDELVLIDQSAPWDARQLAEGLPSDSRIQRRQLSRRGLPSARNAALDIARHPVLVFFDDDVHLDPGCLEGFRDRFSDTSVAGASGRIVEARVASNSPRLVNRIGLDGRVRYNLDAADAGPIESLKGCNMAFRTDLLRRVGGFDPQYGGTAFLEDADASERIVKAGGQLWFEPRASVFHASHPTAGVRSSDRVYDWWRFHNTARFMHQHRSLPARWTAEVTFRVLAMRLAAYRGDPGFAGVLMRAWREGADSARTCRAAGGRRTTGASLEHTYGSR